MLGEAVFCLLFYDYIMLVFFYLLSFNFIVLFFYFSYRYIFMSIPSSIESLSSNYCVFSVSFKFIFEYSSTLWNEPLKNPLKFLKFWRGVSSELFFYFITSKLPLSLGYKYAREGCSNCPSYLFLSFNLYHERITPIFLWMLLMSP